MSAKAKHDQETQQSFTVKDWKKIIYLCEEFELEAALEAGNIQTTPNYGIHLLAYLLVNDLNNARFLWKRIPTQIKSANHELAAIWKIGQTMWTKNYPEIYKAIVGFNWSDAHIPYIQVLAESFRNNVFHLLSKSFTIISVDDASTYLGLTPQNTIQLTTQNGWLHDANTNLLTPKPIPDGKQQSTSLVHLQQLTEYFCYLETQHQ